MYDSPLPLDRLITHLNTPGRHFTLCCSRTSLFREASTWLPNRVSSKPISALPTSSLWARASAGVLLSNITVSIDKIDELISLGQEILSSLHLSDPERPEYLTLLAMMRVSRYNLSDDPDERDLDIAILQSTQAIFLPFHLQTVFGVNHLEAFFILTKALLLRSHESRQRSDAKSCIKCLHFLRNRSFEALNVPYDDVTTCLVDALILQSHSEPEHAVQHVEEISVLCHELLASDVSESSLNDLFFRLGGLAEAVINADHSSSHQGSRQLIECLREAHARLPHLSDISIAFSCSLLLRFGQTGSNDDHEDAIAALDKVIASPSSVNNSDIQLTTATHLAATFAHTRFSFDRNPENLEEAVIRLRTHLESTSATSPDVEDDTRTIAMDCLKSLKRTRLDEFGLPDNSQKEHSPRDPEVVDIPSFSHLAASLDKRKTDGYLHMTVADMRLHHAALDSIDSITDVADIGEAVKYCQRLVASLHPSGTMVFSAAIKLGELLLRLARLTHNTEYLNASIAVQRDIVKIPFTRWRLSPVVECLSSSLFSRFFLFKDRNDFEEIMLLYSIAASDTFARVSDRFKISYRWAWVARSARHPSASTAYRGAIALMHNSLAFAPTLEIQHLRLVAMRDELEQLPLDYASYQVYLGQLTQAIETLERGRGLLWSELRGLRASTDLLRKVNSSLAEKFAAVNQELATLTTSGSPNSWIINGKVGDDEGMEAFSQFVVKQRDLAKERDRLISQIQALPGFERFLKAPPFDTLSSAAAYGPVIINNHCKWRCDIIILRHNSPPSLIATADDFYDRAKGLRDQLLAARKEGLDSEVFSNALSSVLKILYDLVGQPVVERLRELNVPEQSRVWWCPTSVFCSLPLHAMGPAQSDGRIKLYFSDLYIPSYTPTLSALLEARRPGSRVFDKPSMLLVVQPDDEMPNALKEMRVIQAVASSVTTLLSDMAKPSSTLEHLGNHRFAHFSCHGKLEKGKPFDASFRLYEGARLTLLDLVRSQLPNSEFAFLSACHTAELTEESIVDEGLHLTAAVQYCGFRSVVGTMWDMADIDGPGLAGNFYRSVFSNRRPELPYYERTAEALRDTVKILRRKRNMTLERWVNFVHYGA